MVTRKPVASNLVPAPLRQAANNPPYPTSPNMPPHTDDMPPDYGPAEGATSSKPQSSPTRSRSSSQSSTDTWNSGTTADEDTMEHTGPAAQMNTRHEEPRQDDKREELPAALRPGPPSGIPEQLQQEPNTGWDNQQKQWSDQKSISPPPALHSHNPYLNLQKTGKPVFGGETSQSVWGNTPPPPSAAPPPPPPPPAELPAEQMLADDMARTSISHANDASNNSMALSSSIANGLSTVEADRTGTSIGSHRSQSSNPWQSDLDRQRQRQDEPNSQAHPEAPSLLDGPLEELTTTHKNVPGVTPTSQEPQLGPASSPRVEPIMPTSPGLDTLAGQAKRQRSEFYHIKQVNWFDATANEPGRGKGTMRKSPILTQNANGPCPLLALVNALSLTTPESERTALVESLRTREQITLGLLLDAVFEELVRRNEDSGHDLPDVGDLYSFLITLHTGMNVNPRFSDSSGKIQAAQTQAHPGTFEETREMKLYSTFDIPLIHGWMLPPQTATYAAFDRSAPTFEDAQNIQFREEELEDKLRTQGLTAEEQQVFEDVTTIKQFLSNYPTQLTEYGLDIIKNAIRPGHTAILFRNDHFSTLYREPKTGSLMTLVTDAGYSTHDEIVWESLVDVNGAASELFSGDFRPVGHNSGSSPAAQTQNTHAYANTEQSWQTVQPRNQRNATITSKMGPTAAISDGGVPQSSQPSQRNTSGEVSRSAAEQEDHDLALALQLQEEEEDSQRRAAARRRQEEEDLSRQFLESEGTAGRNPQLPPRNQPSSTSRPGSGPAPVYSPPSGPPPAQAMNSSARTDDDTAPPPSYEQAASDRPYRPPGSAPARQRQGDPLGALGALEAQRQQSAFAAQSTSTVNNFGTLHAPAHGRRQSGGVGSPNSNRMRRAQSHGQPVASGSQSPRPGYPGIGASYSGVPAQTAPGARVPEKDCVVM